jgi:phospholipid/cholesterol/gamma-HCH transport system substrate-binding protein
MTKQGENNTRLGIFVATGLFALLLSLYFIGQNKDLFGSGFELRARFRQLNGLTEGNNVMFSGMQAGTVKHIEIIDDTTIEVRMTINKKVKAYVRQNTQAAIGSEGLMGNRVVNLIAYGDAAPLAANGALLNARQPLNMEAMMATFSITNSNVAVISEALKRSILKIDNSELLGMLNDKTVSNDLKTAIENIAKSTENAQQMTGRMNNLAARISSGKGGAGLLLADTAFAANLSHTLSNLKAASQNTDQITGHVNNLVMDIEQHLNDQKTPLGMLLKDTSMAADLRGSFKNIRTGSDGFNANMDAMKHNFMLRGFFKKQQQHKLDSIKLAAKN